MKKIYIDGGELDGLNADCPTGIFLSDEGEPVDAVICGVRIYSMPVSDRDRTYDLLRDCCDIRFLFNDEQIRAEFYPVPGLLLFAYDGAGGCYCTTNMDMDINESDAPIYHINGELKCMFIARSLRALVSTAVYRPGLLRKAGAPKPKRQMNYSEQQELIARLNLNATDVTPDEYVRDAEGISLFRERSQAEQKFEFEPIRFDM